MHQRGPRFDLKPAAGGYAWWYVDGVSDDGAYGLTIIGFIGSVFSPYYAWARRRRNGVHALDHCALNVALYSKRNHRWAMTERGAAQVHQERDSLAIGASLMRWTGNSLDITIEEICVPIPRRIRGVIKLFPTNLGEHSYPLDAAGQHRWTPFAPCARIEVSLSAPRLSWSGSGYFDSNTGSVPLEDTFERWQWSRSIDPRRCLMLYDVAARHEPIRSLALDVQANGTCTAFEPPPLAPLATTRWRMTRVTRADTAPDACVLDTLEDAPFYSRSLVQTKILGRTMPAVHESLDLDRFSRGWVQCLLPFRMPRSG